MGSVEGLTGLVDDLEDRRRAQERVRRLRIVQNIAFALLALGIAILVYAAIGVAIR